jgi:hypothetical protein
VNKCIGFSESMRIQPYKEHPFWGRNEGDECLRFWGNISEKYFRYISLSCFLYTNVFISFETHEFCAFSHVCEINLLWVLRNNLTTSTTARAALYRLFPHSRTPAPRRMAFPRIPAYRQNSCIMRETAGFPHSPSGSGCGSRYGHHVPGTRRGARVPAKIPA